MPLFGISQPSVLGPLSALVLSLFITYAILRHQLFDIRVIIRKIVLYSALLLVVFGMYTSITLVLASYLPFSAVVKNFIAAVPIAFGFEPLRKWLQAVTEKYLFVKEYDPDQEIRKLTDTLSNVVDLDEALRQMMQTTVSALKLDRAATLVLEKDWDKVNGATGGGESNVMNSSSEGAAGGSGTKNSNGTVGMKVTAKEVEGGVAVNGGAANGGAGAAGQAETAGAGSATVTGSAGQATTNNGPVLKIQRVQVVNFPGSKRLMGDEMTAAVNYFVQRPLLQLTEQMQQDIEEEEATHGQLLKIVKKDLQAEVAARSRLLAVKKQAAATLVQLKVAVVVPILIKNKLIGLLLLGDKLSADYFYEDDLNFLTIVGGQTGSAIEKARFYEEDQLKSEFVSIASHELLTPTSAIEGYLSMILDEHLAKVDAKAEGYLRKVYFSAQRLSKLVKDLLSVSRIEAGRIQIQPKVFDLNALLAEQVEQLQPRAKEAKLTLKYEPGKGSTGSSSTKSAFADPERVAQAIVNLVGNGIKYTKEGSVTVRLVDKPRYWDIEVTDTGIGIKEEDRAHLFEKFHRVQNEQTAAIMGTGLGLYITKSIIELMGGRIWVKSEFGQGSTFGFSIPKTNHG